MTRISRGYVFAALLALATGIAGLPVYGEGGPSDTAKELERIKLEMQEKRKGLKRASRKEGSVLAELDKIDRNIQAGSDELLGQQKRLREAETALHEIETSTSAINRELANLKNLYGMRLRALYKMRRSGNAAVYASDSLGSMVKQVKYLGMIAERDREIIRDYGSTLDRLIQRETEVAKKKGKSSGADRQSRPKSPSLKQKGAGSR